MAKILKYTFKTPPGGPVGGPPPLPEIAQDGGFQIDTDLLHKYGNQLIEPADRMGTAADKCEASAATLTEHGLPPWGTGEIGNAFKAWYDQNAVPLIKSVRDMQIGVYNISGKFGVSSKKYVLTEDANMPDAPDAPA